MPLQNLLIKPPLTYSTLHKALHKKNLCGAAFALLMGLMLGCEPSVGSADNISKQNTQPLAQAQGKILTQGMVNDFVAVAQAVADSQFSQAEIKHIKNTLSTDFHRHPAQILEQLHPFLTLANSLGGNASKQQKQLALDNLFNNLTHTTVLEYLAPNGMQQIPTNPVELITLAQSHIGDFSPVVADLATKNDIRVYIFSKRGPNKVDIDNAILSVHDLALTNQIAGGANIGASFQAATW